MATMVLIHIRAGGGNTYLPNRGYARSNLATMARSSMVDRVSADTPACSWAFQQFNDLRRSGFGWVGGSDGQFVGKRLTT